MNMKMLKHKPNIFPGSLAFWILLLVIVIAIVFLASAEEDQVVRYAIGEKGYFEYATSANEVIVEYNVGFGELINKDPQPLLRIYGDGRVHVHLPRFMKNAGDYQMRLTRNKLSLLVAQLIEKGVLTFSEQTVRAEKNAEIRSRRDTGQAITLHLDSGSSTIRLNLTAYKTTDADVETTDLKAEIYWLDLQHDAEQFPKIDALTDLAEAEWILRSLFEHPKLPSLFTGVRW